MVRILGNVCQCVIRLHVGNCFANLVPLEGQVCAMKLHFFCIASPFIYLCYSSTWSAQRGADAHSVKLLQGWSTFKLPVARHLTWKSWGSPEGGNWQGNHCGCTVLPPKRKLFTPEATTAMETALKAQLLVIIHCFSRHIVVHKTANPCCTSFLVLLVTQLWFS